MEVRTLAQLRAEVRYLADAESLTARHPDADLTRRLNASIRALRALVTSNGGEWYIERTTPTTLTGTTVSGEQYSEVPFPVGPPRAVQILGVDIASSTDGDDWYTLEPVSWGARRRGRYVGGGPRYFAIRRVPQADPNDLDAVLEGRIAIFPATEAGAYSISYLPDHVDLAADADVFVGLPDAVQWVVQSVVADLAERDDDQRETYSISVQKKAEAEARVRAATQRVRSAGPLRPRRQSTRWRR